MAQTEQVTPPQTTARREILLSLIDHLRAEPGDWLSGERARKDWEKTKLEVEQVLRVALGGTSLADAIAAYERGHATVPDQRMQQLDLESIVELKEIAEYDLAQCRASQARVRQARAHLSSDPAARAEQSARLDAIAAREEKEERRALEEVATWTAALRHTARALHVGEE